ncbi:MAG: four helix bundle protein [Ignavibacteriaceae bacterium]
MPFDHEKLKVYKKSLEFIKFVEQFFLRNKKYLNIFDQLDRASNSILLNIAEGTGKFTPKDKCKYFDIARGSALECAACLDILLRKKKITLEEYNLEKNILIEIVSMLIGLIKSISDRVYEDRINYESSL